VKWVQKSPLIFLMLKQVLDQTTEVLHRGFPPARPVHKVLDLALYAVTISAQHSTYPATSVVVVEAGTGERHSFAAQGAGAALSVEDGFSD